MTHQTRVQDDLKQQAATLDRAMVRYLSASQVTRAGLFHGAFWSEKAYHGPKLDFHAGGAHHHRGAGSAALALITTTSEITADHDLTQDTLARQAEWAFDWLASRQRPAGGYWEIQNNDVPSDWEGTGLEECSTISTAFAMRGLAIALLNGLPPKAIYARTLMQAGLWQVGTEWPAGSGIFPHHERSPYDTLNANLHAAEMCMAIHVALARVYDQPVNLFSEAARRAVVHTLAQQQPGGHFPYRAGGGVTLNYTAIVVWCLLNLLELGSHLPWVKALAWQESVAQAAAFLRDGFDPRQGLDWQTLETSTARHNMHTYLLIYNILSRVEGQENQHAAADMLRWLLDRRDEATGLLPVKDQGEVILHCLPMQADMLLALRTGPLVTAAPMTATQ